MLGGLSKALRILTIIPIPCKDASELSGALPYFPVVGMLIGGLCALVACVTDEVTTRWALGTGVFAVAIDTILTGAIHLDGLADVFDSLAGSTPAERHRILKDPHIGTYGVVAVVLVLFFRVASFTKLAMTQQWMWFITPFVISRAVMALSASRMQYARENGNVAKQLVEKSSHQQIMVVTIIAVVLCFITAGILGLILLLTGYRMAFVSHEWMNRRYGGITGDLLGMSGIIIETIMLILLAFFADFERGMLTTNLLN